MGIKFNFKSDKKKRIPEEFKDLAKDFAEKGFITTSSENLINWARTGSLTLDDIWSCLLCCRDDANFNAKIRFRKIWSSAKGIAKTI